MINKPRKQNIVFYQSSLNLRARRRPRIGDGSCPLGGDSVDRRLLLFSVHESGENKLKLSVVIIQYF